MTERLSLLRTESKFENLGICDLEGEGVDWEGKPVYLEDLELLGMVSQGRSYISKCGGRFGYHLPGSTDRAGAGDSGRAVGPLPGGTDRGNHRTG